MGTLVLDDYETISCFGNVPQSSSLYTLVGCFISATSMILWMLCKLHLQVHCWFLLGFFHIESLQSETFLKKSIIEGYPFLVSTWMTALLPSRRSTPSSSLENISTTFFQPDCHPNVLGAYTGGVDWWGDVLLIFCHTVWYHPYKEGGWRLFHFGLMSTNIHFHDLTVVVQVFAEQ